MIKNLCGQTSSTTGIGDRLLDGGAIRNCRTLASAFVDGDIVNVSILDRATGDSEVGTYTFRLSPPRLVVVAIETASGPNATGSTSPIPFVAGTRDVLVDAPASMLQPPSDAIVATSEPTGFPNRTDTTIAFNGSTRVFTLAPVASSFDVFLAGIKRTFTSALTVTLTDDDGLWYVYVDSTTGALVATQTFSILIITQHAFVSVLYFDAVNDVAIFLADERHGLVMDAATHAYQHTTRGAVYGAGLALGNLTVDGSGSLDSHAQLSVSDGFFNDEDIRADIVDGAPQDLAPVALVPVFYRSGSTAWRRKTADSFPFIYSGTAGFTGASGRPPFNDGTGGSWSLVEVAENKFFVLHLFATNNIAAPIIAVQGIAQYDTQSAARAGATTEINALTGLPFPEIVALGSVIVQASSAYENTPKARFRSTDIGATHVDFRPRRWTDGDSASSSSVVDIVATAQEILVAGDLVCVVNAAGSPRTQKANATAMLQRLNPIGFAIAAAGANATVTVRVDGLVDVPVALFDAAPAPANVGQRVWMATTAGRITLTAPTATGDVVQRVGVLVDGSVSPKVLVQISDPVLL